MNSLESPVFSIKGPSTLFPMPIWTENLDKVIISHYRGPCRGLSTLKGQCHLELFWIQNRASFGEYKII